MYIYVYICMCANMDVGMFQAQPSLAAAPSLHASRPVASCSTPIPWLSRPARMSSCIYVHIYIYACTYILIYMNI